MAIGVGKEMRRSGYWATSTVLFLLCLMYMITYIDRVNISTAALVFKGELGLTNTDYGAIFAELKSERGVISLDQRRVGSRITRSGLYWVVWRPTQLLDGTIARRLARIAGFKEAA